MIVMPSAEKHEAYAKRGKVNPMPYVGKYDSSTKRRKTGILWEARENMTKREKTRMLCKARENRCDAKRGKTPICWEAREKKSDGKRGKQDSLIF